MADEDPIKILEKVQDTRTYKRRWLIIIILAIFNAGGSMSKVYFGQVNDLYASYFQVTLSALDWLTLSIVGVSFVSCGVLAAISMKYKVGLRTWCLIQCGLISASYVLVAFSCLSRNFFSIAVLAQAINGIPAAIGLVTTPLVAVTWFPPREIGIAMAMHFAGFSFGLCLGFFLPSQLMDFTNYDCDYRNEVLKITSVNFFCFCGALFIFLFGVTYIVVQNKPKLPPSRSELLKRSEEQGKSLNSSKSALFLNIKSLALDRCLCLLTISFALAISNDVILFTMFSDIISARGGDFLKIGEPAKISGYAMTVYGLSHLCSGAIAGKIISCSKNLKFSACIFYTLHFFSIVILIFGLYLSNFTVTCLGLILFGFGTTSTLLSILDIACQHMYPKNELIVSCWLVMASQIAGITSPVIFRYLLNSYGYLITTICENLLLLIGLVLIVISKPNYHRHAINYAS